MRSVTFFIFLAMLATTSCKEPEPAETPHDTTATAPDTVSVSTGSLTKAEHLRHPITLTGIRFLENYWGLDNPVRTLTRSLLEHPEVIPLEGSLGGTMTFMGERRIYVLDSEWVFAYFEDGHSGGYGVFEYTIHENRDITWELVEWHPL